MQYKIVKIFVVPSSREIESINMQYLLCSFIFIFKGTDQSGIE